ncbi:hypothetical protein EDD11_000565 [Mortierella claussenii]|nr:hypothetical protein EDD11_000565 [Mortierella claussenii]
MTVEDNKSIYRTNIHRNQMDAKDIDFDVQGPSRDYGDFTICVKFLEVHQDLRLTYQTTCGGNCLDKAQEATSISAVNLMSPTPSIRNKDILIDDKSQIKSKFYHSFLVSLSAALQQDSNAAINSWYFLALGCRS